jgi:amino acid adenylation domain-containing protein
LATEEVRRPFDLGRGPLVRAILFRLGQEEHVLLLILHHTIFDGWSRGILLQELSVLYDAFSRGAPSPLPALPIQYADFAVWQRQWLQDEILHTQLTYWKQQLDGAPPALELPTDRPRPLVQTFQGARQSLALSQNLSESLKALGRHEEVTLFMTLFAAFTTWLYRYTGQDDILVGTPIANRSRVELEGLMGFFANTLVLRTKLSGELSFRELLRQVRNVALEANAHQDLPFEKLVEELRPERAHHPLFQVMFVLEREPRTTLELPDLTLSLWEVETGAAPFDLTLSMIEQAEGLQGRLSYNTDLFEAATIQRMLGHFQILLAAIVAHPDQPIGTLPLLTEAERHQVLYEWNDTQREYPQDACVHQLFESRVAQTPEQIALVHGERKITYREVNDQANRLAHALQKKGVRPETLVAVCMERSPEVVIAIVAILKAGGALVALDPHAPTERLHYMLQDTGAQLVITRQAFVDCLEKSGVEVVSVDAVWHEASPQSASNPESSVGSENLAYAVYTSGSTGTPKGILVTHRSFVNYALAMMQKFALSPADRRLQFASVSSEPFISEICLSLLAGATLVLRPHQDFASIDEYLRFLEEYKITMATLPSVYWHEWVTAMSEGNVFVPSALRCVITGMDKVRADLLGEWKRKVGGRIRWFNGYGPAEATCVATVYEADFSADDELAAVPIGRPLANTRIYLLDRYLNPVPIGVPGELYIGGHGVARGYLNLPELTAERFMLDRFGDDPRGRLYRTGDLARYLPDGNIQFLGRSDHQVKIRGFRVEPGEVEAVLRQHPAVHEVVVMAREDEANDKRLVAYVVAASDTVASASELRGFLREKLPHYMIPSAFVFLDTLPLTPSGKVDLQALPKPDQANLGAETDFVAPRTPLERALAGIWAQVLGVERVSVYDNFFDLGGHSLLSLKVVHRVEKELGVQLNPRELVIQTLGQLAATCAERRDRIPQVTPRSFTQRLWRAVRRAVFHRQ